MSENGTYEKTIECTPIGEEKVDSESLERVKLMLSGELQRLYGHVKADKKTFDADTDPWPDVEAALFLSVPTHWPFTTDVVHTRNQATMKFIPMVPKPTCSSCKTNDAGRASMTELEKKEYGISRMCVQCQRRFFQ